MSEGTVEPAVAAVTTEPAPRKRASADVSAPSTPEPPRQVVDVVCELPRGPVIDGVQIDGVTRGVDKAAWDRWHAENIGLSAVRSGLIHARDPEA